VPVAPETWLIPNLAAAGPGQYLPVNSLLIRGSEPIIVDTGAPVHRRRWLDQVFSLVDPEDVRWIFLSHDDGDHVGGLADALAMCPSATVVTNFFATERLSLERSLPIKRLRWLEPGDSFLAGTGGCVWCCHRSSTAHHPGLFDERTGVSVGRRLVRGHDHRLRAPPRRRPRRPLRRVVLAAQQPRLTVAPVAGPGALRTARRLRRRPALPTRSPPHTGRC
jgi:hypothetical protein